MEEVGSGAPVSDGEDTVVEVVGAGNVTTGPCDGFSVVTGPKPTVVVVDRSGMANGAGTTSPVDVDVEGSPTASMGSTAGPGSRSSSQSIPAKTAITTTPVATRAIPPEMNLPTKTLSRSRERR